MMAFTEALTPSTTISKQLNVLLEDVNTAVFLVGSNNSIQRTHSWAKFGKMQARPNISIVCLIGMGSRVHVVTVDHKQAVALMTTSIPSATEITNCKTINDIVNLSINMTATASTMAALAITAATPTARNTSATTMTANTTVVPAIANHKKKHRSSNVGGNGKPGHHPNQCSNCNSTSCCRNQAKRRRPPWSRIKGRDNNNFSSYHPISSSNQPDN
jgi:hypothetical protein